ncbi:Vacuole membrane protein 1 (Transmembrane protein 49) [Durusdinium trenchii]|uniref:Vacuole membrane protein 1 (Transmembrane protein 49) n=1 Tax=Durusdinium trenchii TaxID=1381693 RepID=A0ABP0RR24_9DINO
MMRIIIIVVISIFMFLPIINMVIMAVTFNSYLYTWFFGLIVTAVWSLRPCAELRSWPNAAFDMCGMCCGYLLMPFWTFFIATSLGKGVVKVNGQAVLFVNLFGSRAFEVMLTGIDVINSFIEAVVGRNLELRPLASNLRSKLLAKFQQQNRFPPEHLFHNDDDKRLEFDEICKLYDNEEEDKMKEIAHRVLKEWDKDGDKAISVSEAQCAASVTDGKISLSSLDPGAPTSFLKVCWELFIAGLVLYFVVSIMNQMAQSKQAEYDEAKVEELKKKSKKK